MNTITKADQDFFWENGYLIVEDAVDPELLAALQQQFNQWVEESRQHEAPYGETINGKPRFDIEPGHTKAHPTLRRVNAPVEVSQCYYEAMSNSKMLDSVSALIGPNVKFHHSKVNSKLPGAQTKVKWHQDFSFTPHSNDDLITALLMIDHVDETNGPLEVVPGSHRGEIYSLWHDGQFTGAIDDDIAGAMQNQSITCTGTAGSVCLMHTRLLHGSQPNLSDQPRTLFISVYAAEDAIPCAPNPMPNRYEGLIVSGQGTGNVRCINYAMLLPEQLQSASFFDQQSR